MKHKSMVEEHRDRQEISNLTARFFDVFTNTENRKPQVNDIRSIFIKEGLIINNTAGDPQIYDLDQFIGPRKEILTNGTLTDFREREVFHETQVFGHIAQRTCLYEKSGKLNGEYFESQGMKIIQFTKIGGEWKMISLAWCDWK